MSAPNRRTKTGLLHDTGGAVYVEFLIAFIPFFIMVLGIMQLALLYSAHLVVQHAAYAAARSAVVVFPDCPARYDGAPMNVVNGGGSGGSPLALLDRIIPISHLSPGSSAGARLDAVLFAAGWPLLATSPSLDEITHDSDPRRQGVYDAIGGSNSPLERLAFGAMVYNSFALAVTFPRAAHDNNYLDRWSDRRDLTTRVTYLFHCGVPIVSKMACDDALQLYSGVPLEQIRTATNSLRSGHASIRDIQLQADAIQAASQRLGAARPGLDELNHSLAGGTLSALALAVSGGHFYVIRAESTLPVQGAARSIASPCYNASRAP